MNKVEKDVKVSAYRTRSGTRVNPFRRRQKVRSRKDEQKIDKAKIALAAGLGIGGGIAALKLARTVKKDKQIINNLFDFNTKAKKFDFLTKTERRAFLRSREYPQRLVESYSNFQQGDLVKHLLPNGSEHYGVVTVNPDTLEKKITHVIRDTKSSANAIPRVVESSLDENLHVPKISLWQKVDTQTSLSPQEINRRARLLLGAEVKYDSIAENCESYARLIVENKAISTQTAQISKITALGSSMLDNLNQSLRFIPNEVREKPKFTIFGTRVYGATGYGKSDVFYNQKQIKKILAVNEKSPVKDKKFFNDEVEKIWKANQRRAGNFSRYIVDKILFSKTWVDIFITPEDKISTKDFKSFLDSVGIKQPDVFIKDIDTKLETIKDEASKKIIKFKLISDYLKAITLQMNSV